MKIQRCGDSRKRISGAGEEEEEKSGFIPVVAALAIMAIVLCALGLRKK